MKKFIAVFVIAVGLIMTNPTMIDYKAWAKEKATEYAKDDGKLVSAITGWLAGNVDVVTTRDNYWLCSVYTSDVGDRKIKCIGVLKLFIPISK